LQATGRAVVVGERSPGAVMESDMKVFLNGSILMYPVAQLIIPDGTVLEGHGVIPDIYSFFCHRPARAISGKGFHHIN
jgi:C-terminal processing protease CtpA/Prc